MSAALLPAVADVGVVPVPLVMSDHILHRHPVSALALTGTQGSLSTVE
ncbi:hypothetical protein [Streptomyces sp. NPDC091377]